METLFIGKNIIFLPETHSTNSYATDLLKNVNLSEGTVVHTANQTNGKGQRGSAWNVEPGRNLTASIILKPTFLSIKNQFFLYQIVALACYDSVAEILSNSQIDIKIKWPNDILVDKKKIAGILIENSIQNNRINTCVAGIGLNVNQHTFNETINATSLKLISGANHSIEFVLKVLCRHLERHYLALRNSRLHEINEAYSKHLYGLNEVLMFEVQGKRKNFVVNGLGDTGLLLLKDTSGKMLEADVKDVKWIL